MPTAKPDTFPDKPATNDDVDALELPLSEITDIAAALVNIQLVKPGGAASKSDPPKIKNVDWQFQATAIQFHLHPPDDPMTWPLDVFERKLAYILMLNPKAVIDLPRIAYLKAEADHRAQLARNKMLGIPEVIVTGVRFASLRRSRL